MAKHKISRGSGSLKGHSHSSVMMGEKWESLASKHGVMDIQKKSGGGTFMESGGKVPSGGAATSGNPKGTPNTKVGV